MLARRIERPVRAGAGAGRGGAVGGVGTDVAVGSAMGGAAGGPGGAPAGRPCTPGPTASRPAHGRWRTAGRRPTRGPGGEVRWWERPAPGGDEALWEAVCAVQEARLRRGISVTQLAEAVARVHPMRRETLSRVLNGAQATSWQAVEALAIVLDVALPLLPLPPEGEGAAG